MSRYYCSLDGSVHAYDGIDDLIHEMRELLNKPGSIRFLATLPAGAREAFRKFCEFFKEARYDLLITGGSDPALIDYLISSSWGGLGGAVAGAACVVAAEYTFPGVLATAAYVASAALGVAVPVGGIAWAGIALGAGAGVLGGITFTRTVGRIRISFTIRRSSWNPENLDIEVTKQAA